METDNQTALANRIHLKYFSKNKMLIECDFNVTLAICYFLISKFLTFRRKLSECTPTCAICK